GIVAGHDLVALVELHRVLYGLGVDLPVLQYGKLGAAHQLEAAAPALGDVDQVTVEAHAAGGAEHAKQHRAGEKYEPDAAGALEVMGRRLPLGVLRLSARGHQLRTSKRPGGASAVAPWDHSVSTLSTQAPAGPRRRAESNR